MPIYEYRCQECEHVFEEWQKDYSERQASCPICSSPADRLISNTAFILKGTGWYVTDYCNKNNSNSNGGNGNTASADSTPTGSDASTSAAASSGEGKPAASGGEASKAKPAAGSAASTS